MKKIRYLCEALLLHILFLIFRLMPVDTASAIGGWLGRMIGPRLAASRKALRNLEHALPALNETEKRQIICKMWDNLGRVFAEYPHLEYIAQNRVTVKGAEIFEKALNANTGGVFFAGHLGNWEVSPPYLVLKHNIPGNITYRAPNNPWVDTLLKKSRSLSGRIQALPKSRESGKTILNTLKNKEFLGILIDQKYNEGIAVNFFGRPAMTNPVFAQLCQKYNCPLIPVQNRRLNGVHFELSFYEPLELLDEHNQALPIENIIQSAHTHLEQWITQNPGQWLWLHRRWESKQLKD